MKVLLDLMLSFLPCVEVIISVMYDVVIFVMCVVFCVKLIRICTSYAK